MDYTCPICEKIMSRDLKLINSHTEGHIIEVIKKEHPDWVESDGMCKKCYLYYKRQLRPHEQQQQ